MKQFLSRRRRQQRHGHRRLQVGLSIVGFTVIVGLVTGGARANSSIAERVRDTLTVIDVVPTKEQLDHLFLGEPQALQNLSTIAQDKTLDVGVRIRAIHALAKYCPDPCSTSELAHQSLTTLITETRNETLGEPVVLLRAAIETIGTLQVASDVNVLIPLLDHPSRDIRAATARALRDLCNNQAVTPLRVRYTSEPTDQVKLAISEALRILGQCGM